MSWRDCFGCLKEEGSNSGKPPRSSTDANRPSGAAQLRQPRASSKAAPSDGAAVSVSKASEVKEPTQTGRSEDTLNIALPQTLPNHSHTTIEQRPDKKAVNEISKSATRLQLSNNEVDENLPPREIASPPIQHLSESPDPDDHYERIRKSFCKNFDDKRFLPADAIPALTSREAIRPILAPFATDKVPLGSLIDYVHDPEKPATRLFLTLVFCGYTDALTHFQAHGMSDEDLPLEEEGENSSRGADGGIAVKSLNPKQYPAERRTLPPAWKIKYVHDFLDRQWHFLAPVFSRDKFLYVIHKQCPLPFTRKLPGPTGGFQGSVDEIEIHEGHQKVFGSHVRVALKSIRPEQGHYFPQEAGILEVIQKVTNKHLIMPIAAYRFHNEINGCFLFPWAEGGNLKQFWFSKPSEPSRPLVNDKALMAWMLEQSRGLCNALSELHKNDCRHGDLKPENILLFKTGDDNEGTLRIADVGLAKVHDVQTTRRIVNMLETNTMTGTTRYISPEFSGKQIPRVFDVWSLGCVFVEMLMWMLYGNDKLRECYQVGISTYWQGNITDGLEMHPIVSGWLGGLSRHLMISEPSSASSNLDQPIHQETALADLFVVVRDNMLVLDWKNRSNSLEVCEKLGRICDRAAKEPTYVDYSSIASRSQLRSQQPARSTAARLSVTASPRPPLGKLERVATLLDDAEDKHGIGIKVDKVNDDNPTAITTLPTNTRVAQDYNTPQLSRLHNIWRTRTDNDFARGLFARDDWSAEHPSEQALQRLCQKCSEFDIAQPGFETSELVSTLTNRAEECDFCRLLSQAAVESGMADDDELTCRRVDSTIRIDPTGQAILSVYSDPAGLVKTPDIQTGSPLLPVQGSRSQYALMSEWLRVCRETHKHDHHANLSQELPLHDMPTRVLDVGDSNAPQLRLIDRQDMESRQYVALSHCWGSGPLFSAGTDNVASFRVTIDFTLLPLSFQDAILISRGLKVRYLWIDSLCIIQDDQNDWNHEAARMQQVFSNATCVLAASSAASSAEGFLRSPSNRQQRDFVKLQSSSLGEVFYICKSIDDFQRDVDKAVLNKRGWVLQERALARRSIHFSSTQLYMECGNGVLCETLNRLVNERAAFLGDSDFPKSILPYYKGGRIVLFQNLFRTYSGLSFTRVSDRAVAISGLEKRLMAVFQTRGGYGIFELYLERSLLWSRPCGTLLSAIEYPATVHVPSWSWMAYEGSITYLDVPFDGVDWFKDYESPFHTDASGGSRHFWEASRPTSPLLLKSNKARSLRWDQVKVHAAPGIVFDLEPSPYQMEDIRCIVLGKTKSSQNTNSSLSTKSSLNYVMAIAPSSGETTESYIRAGVGAVSNECIDWTSEYYVEVR